ncbi:MAG: shikimate dehydrogenase [Anaerolineaceae bacterium]|nr:MAG: shikimate dehydrogenase [Anaerolineaceae bacterium]
MTDTFGFIIHPIDIKRDVARKYPIFNYASHGLINWLSRFFPPVYLSQVEGVRSTHSHNELTGWLLACPLTPQRMLSLPEAVVYNKIIATGRMAEKLGAKILGLGAFTAVVGDAGVTIAKNLDIPVTTGDSYTVVIAVEAVQEAARQMAIPLESATVAVVGASGAIGRTCAALLARECGALTLIGRREDALNAVREQCEGQMADVRVSTALAAMYEADLVLTVTSAIDTVIEPQHLKPGAVVCDVARPRDVSRQVADQRDDVLVIEGGMVEIPGAVNFNFDFGFPSGKAYACMAETMALALEGRYENYTLGKQISIEQALQIQEIAHRHGFRLSGFRSFEKPVSAEHIAAVRERAQANRRVWSAKQRLG